MYVLGFEYEIESNHFMLGCTCTSICPETTFKKNRVTACLFIPKSMDLYVMFLVKIDVGVASTRLLFSRENEASYDSHFCYVTT